MKYNILNLCKDKTRVQEVAQWFHEKWNIPKEAYLASMMESLKQRRDVPQWYIVLDEQRIVAGLGVIENDFHERKDVTPNVGAVFVEENYRKQGIVKAMLQYVCKDFYKRGVDTLYLLSDHNGFYERYGWSFYAMVQGDGETQPSRMYQHIQFSI